MPQRNAFAFPRWSAFDKKLWSELVTSARKDIVTRQGGMLHGSDRDAGAIEASIANARRAGVGDDVTFEERPLGGAMPNGEAGWLVTNPPYGVRVGDSAPLRNLYEAFGKVLRERFDGWTVAMLSTGGELESRLHVPLTTAFATRNGGIPVKLVVGSV